MTAAPMIPTPLPQLPSQRDISDMIADTLSKRKVLVTHLPSPSPSITLFWFGPWQDDVLSQGFVRWFAGSSSVKATGSVAGQAADAHWPEAGCGQGVGGSQQGPQPQVMT